MGKIKFYIVAFLAVISLSLAIVPAAPSSVAFADAKEEACKGLGATSSEGKCSTGGTSVSKVIDFTVGLLSVIVGIAAVIMIIIGGFKYVTSNGDSNNVASAKNTIIYAIVGLILAAVAQVIARFVLGSV